MDFTKKYGQMPGKERRDYFDTLFNYKNGEFQNQLPTPALLEGESMVKVAYDFFSKHAGTEPVQTIPHQHTDLLKIKPEENILVWFGHSSYFIQLDGKKFLIDPVFSGSASPFPGTVKSFPGTEQYKVPDMPGIDVLFISHDHWDHLDYKTIQQLEPKVDKVICGLGVAQHFEYWGWNKNKLIEKNWYETVDLGNAFRVTLMPARHFSGRLFKRNISLWTSFVLQMPGKRLFLGGDSGYGTQFKEIGERFGPFDLAILECGQYNEKWPYIHSLPNEVIKEALELKAKNFMPVHNSKFKLAQHPWYEPLEMVTELAEKNNMAITTPEIGEKVNLDDTNKVWRKWWQNKK